MLKFFDEITQIPRPSGFEDRMADYLCEFAKKRGLYCRRDEFKNVVIKKPASPGRENEDAIILQAHTDMVCEKDAGVNIDFRTMPIEYEIKDGLMRAKGTTLGADDGIGIAMMLAILDNNEISTPALECIFTADEEVGLIGANGLDCHDITGSNMINLDSEEEGYVIIGCAGGGEVNVSMETTPEKNSGKLFAIGVEGLMGGHSGTDINKNRGNANVILAGVLKKLYDKYEFNLVNINGGSKINAIPRSAGAVISIKEEFCEKLKDDIIVAEKELKEELTKFDPKITLKLTALPGESESLSVEATKKALELITAFPNGVIDMNPGLPDQVRTSLNFGVMRLNDNILKLTYFLRSSDEDRFNMLRELMFGIADRFEVNSEIKDVYPGWESDKNAPIVTKAKAVYKSLFGKEPIVMAIHAGLECGILSKKFNNIDVISIGPDITNAHSPGETLDVESAKRTYEYLIELLK